MLKQNFQPDENQNDPAGKLRLLFVFRAESVADSNAKEGQHKSYCTNKRYRKHYAGVRQQREGYADGERVDTGGNGKNK